MLDHPDAGYRPGLSLAGKSEAAATGANISLGWNARSCRGLQYAALM